MSIEELEHQKQYWINIKAYHIDLKNKFIEEKCNKYVPTSQSLSVAVESANELCTLTSKAMNAMNAGMVIGDNKSFEQDELDMHAKNMETAAKYLSQIVDYCDQQIKYLDERISQEDFEISFAQKKIDEYEAFLVAKTSSAVDVASDSSNDSAAKGLGNKKIILPFDVSLYD